MTSIISAVSTKGGSGKSTTIRILAAQLAFNGCRVVILDTDPQLSCVHWLKNAEKRGEQTDNVVAREIDEIRTVEPLVQSLKGKVDYVLIDLQGAATGMLLPIAKVSDLIILPWATTHDDWTGLKNTFVLLDTIRQENEDIDPLMVISNNRITATEINHPYVAKRFEIAELMKVKAAETLLWRRMAYSNMLLKTGFIPQTPDNTDQMLKAKTEHKAYTDEILAIMNSKGN
ncbi:ParA family protein [Bartonella choladocola]|uniref:Chromosome partitioning protein n=1 Tax=Bartonella choladocola TaxID=2750995 RepID=A0A1U9MJS0_9HYPH|nr:ParA family protein [Bartonella choladocola]AQT47963.1 chromosome partitioning protein [Bartonella choladocola]